MNLVPFFLIVLITAFPLISTAQTADDLIRSAAATNDLSAQAKLYKQTGDKLIDQDQTEQAAEAFSKALAAGRESFSSTEIVQMAIYLSWADRLTESKLELTRVLAKEPKNIAARSHLARVLSWSGELREAIVQADLVLQESPDHKDALLVKADALQWQGRYAEAIPIYQKIIARGDDFDARAGLARSLLAVGNRTGAIENKNMLKPANGRQQREFAKLSEAIDQETRPIVDARYNYYRDSDHNRLNRYSLNGSFWVDNQKYGLSYRHTDATDRTRDNHADDLLFRIYSRLNDPFGAGAGIGFTRLDARHDSTFPAGYFRADAKLFAGSVGANVTREVLTDTAELIQNRIRMTNVGLYISQPLTDRISVYGGYNYKTFSDSNHANDLQFSSQYAIFLAPKLAVGYRFRYLDFSGQSHSGFFDPDDYVANRAFTSFYYEHKLFYTYLDSFLGYETFRRDGSRSNNFIYGGTGSVGVKPVTNLAIEVNVEGGNFSAGSAAGFNYLVVGPRILYRF